MTLRLYNTLTRHKDELRPLDPKNVRMYVCGPTVYDFAHIGNARPVIVFDVLFRLLRHLYGAKHVTYVRNITDVDDKINKRAAEEGIAIRALTETTARQFHEDVAALGCLPPTFEPRATEYVRRDDGRDMITMIERLIGTGNAYAADGHVLFHVPSMPDYGRLARRSLDEMIAGARVDVAPYKKDPMDFVLWKPSKPGEPAWESPWGPGRPGWHIECSAMAAAHLGQVFDIHGGGIDLVFPHHENELAQSRCAFQTDRMAQIWMHNGFLQVEGEKMAKSLGNFVTIRELLDRGWPGEVLRFAMLKTHYRQPINWTHKGLVEATLELQAFANWTKGLGEPRSAAAVPAFLEALTDDLNTPKAITALHQHLTALNTSRIDAAQQERFDQLLNSLDLLGLGSLDDFDANRIIATVTRGKIEIDEQAVLRLIAARNEARKAKNWAEADRLRDALAGMGVALKDSKDPETGEPVTTWEIAR